MSAILARRRSAAARHVLLSSALLPRTGRHLAGGRIDWLGLLAGRQELSGGEQFLVEVARRLWAGEALPSWHELTGRLDPGNLRRIAEALDYLDEPSELAAAA
jgi:hypothetical protein